MYMGYFGLTSGFFVIFARDLLKTEYSILLLACGFFALSILIDVSIPQTSESWVYLYEDGFKFFGIVHWCLFFVRTAFQQVNALNCIKL